MSSTDIVVIGGGVTGLGVALEASRWGFGTILCERNTLGSGTSANSLRIIHGGFRYLQQLNVQRVLESAQEQTHWISEVPHLIKPLSCLTPLSRWGLSSALPARLGSLLYGAVLAAVRSPLQPPRVLSQVECEQRCEALVGKVPFGALYWQDALLEDHEGLVRYLSGKLREAGVDLRENTLIERLSKNGERWDVVLADGTEINAHVVIDARGTLSGSDVACGANHCALPPAEHSSLAAAINLEFDFQLDPKCAIGMRSSSGRLFFAVPRGDRTAIGTWYYAYDGSKDVRAEQVQQFQEELRQTFEDSRLTRERICRVDYGVLPMQRVGVRGPVLYGRHRVREHDGVVRIMSTKYTTFRRVGVEALRCAKKALRGAL